MQSIQFDLDRNDYLQASLIHIKPRRMSIFKYSLLSITFLLIFYFMLPGLMIYAGTAALSLTLFLFGKYYLVNPYQEKKYFEGSEQEGFHFEFDYDDETFTISTHTGEATLRWNEIWDWRLNNNYLLIYASTMVYHVLPRDFGPIADNLNEIESILLTNRGKPS